MKEELRGDGAALPWVDLTAFATRAIGLAAAGKARVENETGWVFFDRGLVDAAVALEYATGRPARQLLAPFGRYHHKVFLMPPWPEIYVNDDKRRHSLGEAMMEYDRLVIAYRQLGYETAVVPKVSVEKRADYVLHHLA